MGVNVNNVKNGAPRGYHHGDLRSALIAAGLETIAQSGPDAFSLRAAARRAGVSPAAPAHHFGDARGLLTAIATVGFVELGEALAGAGAGGVDRSSRLRAHCHAYLRFALSRPGLFRLMWRREMLDTDDPAYVNAARHTFAVSDAVVRPGAARAEPGDPALAPTLACWSLVHGFVGLVMDGAALARAPDPSAALDAVLDTALADLRL